MAERDDVSNGVAADTVRAVDTAGHFTGCIKPRNYLALTVKDASLRIDAGTAHRVVTAHAEGTGIERRLFDLAAEHLFGTTERILLAVDQFVVLGNRLLHRISPRKPLNLFRGGIGDTDATDCNNLEIRVILSYNIK